MNRTKTRIAGMVKEELAKLNEAVAEKGPDIAKKLEELRKKIEKEGKMGLPERLGDDVSTTWHPNKRVELKTVSELCDLQINELMLYLLNHVKTNNERSLVEYHLGYVHFYPTPKN